jgi:hypothetical protein
VITGLFKESRSRTLLLRTIFCAEGIREKRKMVEMGLAWQSGLVESRPDDDDDGNK